jgi:hypothetical protein
MRSDATLQIVLPLPLPQWFDYLPPTGHSPGDGDIGKRVRVPFGSREMTGVVAGIGTTTGDGPEFAVAVVHQYDDAATVREAGKERQPVLGVDDDVRAGLAQRPEADGAGGAGGQRRQRRQADDEAGYCSHVTTVWTL